MKEDIEAQVQEKASRVTVFKKLQVDISHARVYSHMKDILLDPHTVSTIKSHKQNVKKLYESLKGVDPSEIVGQHAETLANIETIKQDVKNLQAGLPRISSKAPVTLAVAIDYALKELIKTGIRVSDAGPQESAGKSRVAGKTVDVAHIHGPEVEDTVTYPMWASLESYRNYDPVYEEELKQQRSIENKADREARKLAKEAKSGEPQSDAPEISIEANIDDTFGEFTSDSAEDAGESGESKHSKVSFKTYVSNAIKTIKVGEGFADRSVRTSERLREYCSEMIIEFIVAVSKISRTLSWDIQKLRTIGPEHVIGACSSILLAWGKSSEDVATFVTHIKTVTGEYDGCLKDEAKKKPKAEKTPEELALSAEAKKEAKSVAMKKRIEKQLDQAGLLAEELNNGQDISTVLINGIISNFGQETLKKVLREVSAVAKRK